MDEYVVTLTDGTRHDDVAAETYERVHVPVRATAEWRHEFRSRPPGLSRWWPEDRILLVQRRDGHLLEQVWPLEATE